MPFYCDIHTVMKKLSPGRFSARFVEISENSEKHLNGQFLEFPGDFFKNQIFMHFWLKNCTEKVTTLALAVLCEATVGIELVPYVRSVFA